MNGDSSCSFDGQFVAAKLHTPPLTPTASLVRPVVPSPAVCPHLKSVAAVFVFHTWEKGPFGYKNVHPPRMPKNAQMLTKTSE
jgi:hypothetical protein